MPDETIRATYWIETPEPVEKAAAALAGEQSCGTFVRVPGETNELRQRHLAKVESIKLLETVTSPSLPISKRQRQWRSTRTSNSMMRRPRRCSLNCGRFSSGIKSNPRRVASFIRCFLGWPEVSVPGSVVLFMTEYYLQFRGIDSKILPHA